MPVSSTAFDYFTAASGSLSSASISYTAGQPILVMAGGAASGFNPTISDTAGLTWNLIKNTSDTNASSYAWYAQPVSGGSTTITISNSATTIHGFRVRTFTGAATPLLAGSPGFGSTGSISSATLISQSVSPTSPGSMLFLWSACSGGQTATPATAGSGCSIVGSGLSAFNLATFEVSPTTNPLTSNASFTLACTTDGTSQDDVWIAIEVPLAGPGVTAQPTQQSYAAGGTATFSITASGGAAPLTYQWQSAPITSLYANVPGTWSNISGATSSSYTTPNLGVADDGTWYQCTVTDNNSATATSAPARAFMTGTGAAGRGLLYGPSSIGWRDKFWKDSPGQLLWKSPQVKDPGPAAPTVWRAWFFQTTLFGDSATIDGADVMSASGTVSGGGGGVSGSSATTDGADAMSASGAITTTGTSATTDGADVMSASGVITTTGTSATTDGADVMAASGAITTTGTSATTDGADVMSASGDLTTTGTSATTDGADVMAASGSVTGGGISGTSTTTDGSDVMLSAGDVASLGTSATTDGADVMAAAGDVASLGTIAVTDGADVMSASGGVTTVGTMTVTDGADVMAASGGLLTNGTMAVTEGADVMAAVGGLLTTGSSATTDGADVMAATGAVSSAISGTMAVTEGADVMVAGDGPVYPLPSQVLAGVHYGPTGFDFTGTLVQSTGHPLFVFDD